MPRTARGAITLAEEDPTLGGSRLLRRGLAAVMVVAVGTAGWLGWIHLSTLVSGPTCRATASGATWEWATDQASNAATITAIGRKRGLPPRAASIALATAMQESKVRNVRFGDRDSLGLFQQRPSQGWGTAEQILNPEYSTNKFYDALIKVKGYATMEIAVAAQEVQRSADGSAYAQHEAQARATASTLSGQTAAGFACALKEAEQAGDPKALASVLKDDHGVSGSVDGSVLQVTASSAEQAWSVAAWAVAKAEDHGVERVVIGDREWVRSLQESAFTWGDAKTPTSSGTAVRIELAS